MTATFAKQSIHKISINCSRPKGRFFMGVNMGREFFDEYCSPELLALITGYVCPKYQMKSLNEFGIPFLHPKGNRKFPLVLRSDGDKILKGEKVQPITQTKERRRSAVLS